MTKISLESLRLWRGNPRVRIYSREHHAWWRKDGAGYAVHVDDAGIWTIKDALIAVGKCGPEKGIEFEAVE